MIIDSLGSRVDITLTLTISARIVTSLSAGLDDTSLLLKFTAVVAAFLTLLAEMLHSYPSSVWYNMAIVSHRLSVFVFVQVLLDSVRPGVGRDPTDIFADLEITDWSRGGMLSYIPLSVWPIIESFVVSSLLIIAVTLVARIAMVGNGGNHTNVPELDRLLRGIQYSFADTVGVLLVDHRVRNVLAFIGTVALKPLTDTMAEADTSRSAVSVWTSGIAMAWVQLVTGIIVPDGKWSVSIYIETVTAMGMAVLLQALSGVLPGLQALQGYVEWHLSNVFARGMVSTGIDRLQVIAWAAAVLIILYAGRGVLRGHSAKQPASSTSAMDTLSNIATLMIVNTAARALMEYIEDQAVVDTLTVIVITIVLAKSFVHIFVSVTEAGLFTMYG